MVAPAWLRKKKPLYMKIDACKGAFTCIPSCLKYNADNKGEIVGFIFYDIDYLNAKVA
ncbi:MAG: hypothetical protein RM338_10670 [Nostoc sp. DedQUE12a]|nr:hypothetical protein [Nostoc sp. DedQUE12a]